MAGEKTWLHRAILIASSIRFRLALWFVLTLGMALLIFGVFVYSRLANDLQSTALARLELKARRLGDLARYSEREFFDQAPVQLPNDPNSGAAFIEENDVLSVIAANGQIIKTWGPLSDSRVSTLLNEASQANLNAKENAQVYFSSDLPGSPGEKKYVFLTAALLYKNRLAGYLLLGNPVDPDGALPRLAWSLLIGGALTLAAALAGGFWLADRAMRPVSKITQTARQISETDLSQRLHLEQNDEIGELADTFDDMLSRLQAAFDRQRQFTADASHELRTPLTIIELEASRALAAPRPPGEYQESLRVIQAENQTMTRLVNNLLTLARMDAGQARLQMEALDLSDVLVEVVERMEPLAKEAGVKLAVGELPELPILGDRAFLIQMLTNLVDNAIKYSGGDEPRVALSAGSSPGVQPASAWVRVADNGQGIPTEHLPHLFERFYQVDAARSSGEADGHGAGLGLAIARWIAQAHGGDVRVESTLGEGTTFEVRLPLRG